MRYEARVLFILGSETRGTPPFELDMPASVHPDSRRAWKLVLDAWAEHEPLARPIAARALEDGKQIGVALKKLRER